MRAHACSMQNGSTQFQHGVWHTLRKTDVRGVPPAEVWVRILKDWTFWCGLESQLGRGVARYWQVCSRTETVPLVALALVRSTWPSPLKSLSITIFRSDEIGSNYSGCLDMS